MKSKPLVGIIMGSDSDLPIMQDVASILEEFTIPYEMAIISAHRTPERIATYARSAARRGLKVIVTGAGGSAHLAGVTASFTTLPVIGIPIKAKSLEGLDSLLSIVQMPPGVPVATVGVNGAKNAGLLAIQILATGDKHLEKKLTLYKENLGSAVEKKSRELEKIGYKEYLAKAK